MASCLCGRPLLAAGRSPAAQSIARSALFARKEHTAASTSTARQSEGPYESTAASSSSRSDQISRTDQHDVSSAQRRSKRSQAKTIFSGIQPTGIPHIGNYLGAMRQWVDLQNTADYADKLYFSVVGLHAITVPQDPETLRRERDSMMATLVAIGLDPKRVTLFNQEAVPEHAELAWYLNCITPFGRLQRMTTWKSKLATIRNVANEEHIDESQLSLGLFAYPVLQAADILLYRSTHVPVGEDQVQHLELARDIAQTFNRTYKAKDEAGRVVFPRPEPIITPSKRVLSLRDPTQKMSKSSPDAASRILLTDTDDEIAGKLKRAVTDSEPELSYDPERRPGVSNLLTILAAFKEPRASKEGLSEPMKTPADWAAELNAQAGGSGQTGRILKEAVTEATIAAVRPIRQEIERLRNEEGYLREVQKHGNDQARQDASQTMHNYVRRFVGLNIA